MAAHDHHYCCSYKHIHAVLLFVFLIFVSYGCEEMMATRILDEEQWINKNVLIQSLPRGPVPPSQGSPCTYVPGRPSHGRCALAGDFSGHAVAAVAPPAFPPVMVHFGVVYTSDESHKEDSS